ncbi:ankyrin repeat and IBR domain-containing protein 1-like isoform X2 [Salvelinus fontinalis]|uniref:ankyrin repeat and IBR domain-containing protein 1-like isoform X2 n=1 Tax=Salvelinus fontinalis TaxID=8038 RepID=UPI002485BC6F|nr:ankyrin repeat and IBR domain-containing protein 1-like isoform X2 [Salvelinus fontinalis]
MGNTATKFRKALINGDEGLAYQLYEGSPQFKESLDPNTSYGEPYQHNTPLHYAARHAMTRLIRSFLFSKDGNPNKRNVHNETSLHLLCMGSHILMGEGALQPRLARPELDEMKRAECLQIILKWTGAKLDRGEYENANVNATDNKKNTSLHYAAASGMKKCVELYEGLRPQELRRLKDMLIVETADMLQTPLFTAEALLRAHDWDRENLLEAWMSNAEECCQRSGVHMPSAPPSGHNAWDTLPSPRTPRTTRSSITSPDEISLSPGDDDRTLCGICMCPLSIFEEPVDVSCGHEFCRACWEGFLNLKIQEGEAHNIFCPAHDCFQLVPVEVIESVVSREMDQRYLQFDIKAFVENNPAIRWCPKAGCERAVRLSSQGPGSSSSDPFSQPLLRAPAVDCGKGHVFCWECQGEAHEPCDCQTWKMWLAEVTEMRPQELAGVSEAYEDAANCLWLLSNAKPCANCKSPIQKNEGCNHMQCAKCKYDFCWICLEEWKKHSSSTGGYYRCTRYEVINQVEEQNKDMTVEAEKKHKGFQELDRFMHYYTRFKNHEHSYQLEQRLLKTAKDKMEQLSRALSGRDGGPPDTTFIEDAVLELLKTRRILKCSYPYGFFLEIKSTKKEIFELMQTDLEMVTEDLAQKVNRPYLRTPRHKIIRAACLVQQKRQEFLASVARGVAPSDSPEAPRRSFGGGTWDWEYLGFASPEEYAEFQYRRRHRDRQQRRQRGDIPHLDDSGDSTLDTQEMGGGRRHGPPMSSLDEDDPNILLAIQLSLQESGLLAMAGDTPEFLSNEASLGAIGTSLPSRLDAESQGLEVGPRGAISSSELLELEDRVTRLGNMGTISSQRLYEGLPGVYALHHHPSQQHYSNHHLNPFREPSSREALFSSSSGTTDSTTTSTGLQDPSHPNTNLLGNIMAWFHDMNPQSITLMPSTITTSSDTDLDFDTAAQTTANTASEVKEDQVPADLHQPRAKPQKGEGELGEDGDCFPFLSQGLEEKERPSHLDLTVGSEVMASSYMVTTGTGDRAGGNVVHVDTPMCDSVTSDLLPSTSSSEWEEQIHLV